MTDLVERRLNTLRMKAFETNSDSVRLMYFDELSRAFQAGELVPATALESKDKELAALREAAEVYDTETRLWKIELDRKLAAAEARAETSEQRVKVLEARQADDLAEFGLMEVRAETAERERDRIADELDTMNNNHRVMAKLLADTG